MTTAHDVVTAYWAAAEARDAGPMTGVCFFDLTAEGKIQAITDFWPTQAELPPSRAHLVERY